MAVVAHRLGAVDEQAHGGDREAVGVAAADAAGAMVVGEVGQPAQRGVVVVDGAKEKGGMLHPVEGRHEDEWYALEQGEQEAGNEAHVVVEG